MSRTIQVLLTYEIDGDAVAAQDRMRDTLPVVIRRWFSLYRQTWGTHQYEGRLRTVSVVLHEEDN